MVKKDNSLASRARTQMAALRERARQRGVTMVEALVVIGIAGAILIAVLIGVNALSERREVRVAITEMSDISAAVSTYYNNPRITAPADGTAMNTAIVGSRLLPDGMINGTNIQNQNGENIVFVPDLTVGAANFSWPSYAIRYNGMSGDGCVALLSALQGPQAVQVVLNESAAITAWTAVTDHRADPSTNCNTATNTGANDIYDVWVVYRT